MTMNTALCVRYPSFFYAFHLSKWEHMFVVDIYILHNNNNNNNNNNKNGGLHSVLQLLSCATCSRGQSLFSSRNVNRCEVWQRSLRCFAVRYIVSALIPRRFCNYTQHATSQSCMLNNRL